MDADEPSLLWVFALIFLALYFSGALNEDLERCQKGYSLDTCVNSILR